MAINPLHKMTCDADPIEELIPLINRFSGDRDCGSIFTVTVDEEGKAIGAERSQPT
jgi:hypothetical protein